MIYSIPTHTHLPCIGWRVLLATCVVGKDGVERGVWTLCAAHRTHTLSPTLSLSCLLRSLLTTPLCMTRGLLKALLQAYRLFVGTMATSLTHPPFHYLPFDVYTRRRRPLPKLRISCGPMNCNRGSIPRSLRLQLSAHVLLDCETCLPMLLLVQQSTSVL